MRIKTQLYNSLTCMLEEETLKSIKNECDMDFENKVHFKTFKSPYLFLG
jgi:hypothetical protein